MNINYVPYEVDWFVGNENYKDVNYDLSNNVNNSNALDEYGDEFDDIFILDEHKWFIKINNNRLFLKQLPVKNIKLDSENEDYLKSHELLFSSNLFPDFSLLKDSELNIYYLLVYLKIGIIYIFKIEKGSFKLNENKKIFNIKLKIKETVNEFISNFHIFKKTDFSSKFSLKINKKAYIYIYKIDINMIKNLKVNYDNFNNINIYKTINYGNIINNFIKNLFVKFMNKNENYIFYFKIINKGLIIVLDKNFIKIINYKKMKIIFNKNMNQNIEDYNFKIDHLLIENNLYFVISLFNYDLNKNIIKFFSLKINYINDSCEELNQHERKFYLGEFRLIKIINENKIIINYIDINLWINKIIIWELNSNNIIVPYLKDYIIMEEILNFKLIKNVSYEDLKYLLIERIFKNNNFSNKNIMNSLKQLNMLLNSNQRNLSFIGYNTNINKSKNELKLIFQEIAIKLENDRNMNQEFILNLFQVFYKTVCDNFIKDNLINNIKIEIKKEKINILFVKKNFSYSIIKQDKNNYNLTLTIKLKVFEFLMNNYYFIFLKDKTQNKYFYEKINHENIKIIIFDGWNFNLNKNIENFLYLYCNFLKNLIEQTEYINFIDFFNIFINNKFNIKIQFKDLIIKYNNFFKSMEYNQIIFDFDKNNQIEKNEFIKMGYDFNDNIINIEKNKFVSQEIELFNYNYLNYLFFKMVENSEHIDKTLNIIKNYLVNIILKEEVINSDINYINSNNINMKFFYNKNSICLRDIFIISNNLFYKDNDKEKLITNNFLLYNIIDFDLNLNENNNKLKNIYDLVMFLEKINELKLLKCLLDLCNNQSIIVSYYYLKYFINDIQTEEFKHHYVNFMIKFKTLLKNNSNEFYLMIFFYENGIFNNNSIEYKNLYENINSEIFKKISSNENLLIKEFFFEEILKDEFLNIESKSNIIKSYINYKIENDKIIEAYNIINYFKFDKKTYLDLLNKWNESIMLNKKIKKLIDLKVDDIYVLRIIDDFLKNKKIYLLDQLKNNKKIDLKLILKLMRNILVYKEKLCYFYKDYNDALNYGFDIYINFEETLIKLDKTIINEYNEELKIFRLFILNYLLIFLNYNEKYNYYIKNISTELKNKIFNSMIEFTTYNDYEMDYKVLNKNFIEKFRQGVLINNLAKISKIEINQNYEFLLKYLICSNKIKEACSICYKNEKWLVKLIDILFFFLLNKIEEKLNSDYIVNGFEIIFQKNKKFAINLFNLYLSVYSNKEIIENKKFNEKIKYLIRKYFINYYPEKAFLYLYNLYNKELINDFFEDILKYLKKKLNYKNKEVNEEMKFCLINITYYLDSDQILYKKYSNVHYELIQSFN